MSTEIMETNVIKVGNGEIVHKTMRNQPVDSMPTLFSSTMMKPILATHAPDGREFDVKPLFLIIQNIMLPTEQSDAMEDKTHSDIIKHFADPIKTTSSEMFSKCDGGENPHLITMSILQSLASYTWEAKATIALAAFAVSYGGFRLVDRVYSANPALAECVALVKVPETTTLDDQKKQEIVLMLERVIKAMVDVCDCVIRAQAPQMVKATSEILPNAVYWIIRTIVACAMFLLKLKLPPDHSHYVSLSSLNHRQSQTSKVSCWDNDASAKELNILADVKVKLYNIKWHLEEKMGSKTPSEIFIPNIIRLHEAPVMDFSTLRLLIPDPRVPLIDGAHNDGLAPLFDGTHKKICSIDVLRGKHVLLLLSDLDHISDDDEQLSILHQIHVESRLVEPTRFEIVWFPVFVERSAPWTKWKQNRFEGVLDTMPWYSLAGPMMRNSIIRFITEEWGFTGEKPRVVVLDPQGNKTNDHALPMMWIWGSLAFPFSKSKQEALWRNQTWRVDFLAGSIHKNLLLWVSENRYICLYGGEDIEWIRKFTTTARAVANAAGIPLEMLYVGKSDPKESVETNNSIIKAEKLSHVLPELTLVRSFWVRLEIMRNSTTTVENVDVDPMIMQEIETVLSFDGSNRGWAVFARGSSHEMAKGKAETMLQCLLQFDSWKDKVVERAPKGKAETRLQRLLRCKDKVVCPDGFVTTLNEQLHQLDPSPVEDGQK